MSDLVPPGGHYTHRVMALASRAVVEDGLPYRAASWRLWRDHRVFVPFATIQNWVEAGGKRATERLETDYLDWALDRFSGYLAADELYDGPFCVLSIVDTHSFKRLFYQVLDHEASQADVLAFFQRFRAVLGARGLVVRAITTDGASCYLTAIPAVFGAIAHQVCQFHMLRHLTDAVLHAVAKVRKHLAAALPKLPRGRTPKRLRKLAQRHHRLQQKLSDLFTHRYLFVQHHLTSGERKTLQQITRGPPQLRTLRATPAPPSGACHG